jgi:putative intracellular protease/amidase
VVRAARRYDPRILQLLAALDDRGESMAEVCRRVAAAAESLGLTRPSYVHLRRRLVAMRRLQDDRSAGRESMLDIAYDVATDLVLGRRVNAYVVAERVHEARVHTAGRVGARGSEPQASPGRPPR